MPVNSLSENFIRKLQQLQKEQGTISADDIRKTIQELALATNEVLLTELRSVMDRIHHVRSEMGKLDGQKLSKEFIPSANLELEAIVKATEQATNIILDAAEGLQATAKKAPREIGDAINLHTGKIVEACTFQDITGQRVSRVVKTLVDIEKELEGFLSGKPASKASAPAAKGGAIDEASLMNGPQLKQPSQEEIDKLFDSL
jgi:chemotaxis protein CheZ